MSLNTSTANASELVEIETLLSSMDAPIASAALPRWQRKQMQAQQASLSTSQDRFIPNRSAMNLDMSAHALSKENGADTSNVSASDVSVEYQKTLQNQLLEGGEERDHRVLAFRNKAPIAADGYQSSLRVLYTAQASKKPEATVKATRHIPSAPIRVLDAPELMDDYYLNLISWSSQNVLAVALARSVYLWDASTGTIEELMSLPGDDDYVSSVSWLPGAGTHLAIGTSTSQTQLWDATNKKAVRSMGGHTGRVGALSWNNHIVSSGSRDATIIHHDVRIQKHQIATLAHHQQEVCGLAWSLDGTALASGANDNTLCIWDAAMSGASSGSASNNATTMSSNAPICPRHVLTEHLAAVKALAWCPHERNVLASGGGTADRCIKMWNTQSGSMLNSVDTGSQVCSLVWSANERELLSSHGYAENQLCLWKYPFMTKIKEFKGHTARVLHLAASPDGQTVVSGAADETLRFWNIFNGTSSKKSTGKDSAGASASSAGAALASSTRMR